MRILIRVAYDGSGFNGWQIQPDKRTVEGDLTDAVAHIAGKRTPVVGSGRTDTGVHALNQAAHFDLEKDFDVEKIPRALNFYLGDDVRVIDAKQVADDFHARKSAKRKTYVYKIYQSRFDNPLLKNRELRIDKTDTELMKEAAKLFVGRHDFRAYMSSGSSVENTVREVCECKIISSGNSIRLKITANGFLYNMVRKITATALAVANGKKALSDIECSLREPYMPIKEIAPPHGLYLHSVKY